MPDSDQLPEAQATATRQRRLMNLPILACMAALIILDVAARSRVSVTPLFVFLVVWAAWREGFLYASVSGLLLSAVHVAKVWEIGLPGSIAPSALEGFIRAVTFVALAFVTSRAAWRFHVMRRHIVELEKAARLPGLRTHPRERWQLAAPGRDPSAKRKVTGAVSRMRAQTVREPFVIGPDWLVDAEVARFRMPLSARPNGTFRIHRV